jgi:molybdate transport system permease protein
MNEKYRIGKLPKGETAFKFLCLSALGVLVLFFSSLVLSLLSYTSWSAFKTTLLSGEILFAVKLSLLTATASTLLSLIFAVPVAHALSRSRFPGKFLIDTILDLPIVISPIALGAALLVFFNTRTGTAIENTLGPFVFEVRGIILAQFTVVSALAVRLLKSTFDSIDPRYEQVSRTLGCSKWKAFYKVTLPLAKNGLLAAAILTWARAVGEFGATVTLAGATKMKTETLPISIFLNLATADVKRAVAVIFILIIIAASSLVALRMISAARHPL